MTVQAPEVHPSELSTDALVDQVRREVRRLSAQSFDLARAYACGGDVLPLARQAAALDAELARREASLRVLPHPSTSEIAGRCDSARRALTHLLAAPRLLRARL